MADNSIVKSLNIARVASRLVYCRGDAAAPYGGRLGPYRSVPKSKNLQNHNIIPIYLIHIHRQSVPLRHAIETTL
jgi:hypothetical protein